MCAVNSRLSLRLNGMLRALKRVAPVITVKRLDNSAICLVCGLPAHPFMEDCEKATKERGVWEVMTFGLLDENLTKSKVAIITS